MNSSRVGEPGWTAFLDGSVITTIQAGTPVAGDQVIGQHNTGAHHQHYKPSIFVWALRIEGQCQTGLGSLHRCWDASCASLPSGGTQNRTDAAASLRRPPCALRGWHSLLVRPFDDANGPITSLRWNTIWNEYGTDVVVRIFSIPQPTNQEGEAKGARWAHLHTDSCLSEP